ncbi:hypothetical protein EV356DRAFT_516690 [Viridothelium virens]|uniref:C2H2-type domain-containing protein n=1 Tax=Viridothelium virens TaxID=1048519 RepID=A0A6A6HL73_VIRVR|nr:hypothetical protein EV356DRAFT_516690 [Viridothelium virens]
MLSDTPNTQSAELSPTDTNDSAGAGAGRPESANGRPTNAKPTVAQTPSANFPPPKTDKPRPHVCGTCGRSFARLEHLKRHERSHTKEKPFECPECTRCFARRDLLLRHQQKLHMTTTASSRPRSGRRESTSGMPANGAGRVRKNSIANSAVGGSGGVGTAGMRPRAATISHIEGAGIGLLAGANPSFARNPGFPGGHAHHPSLGGLPGPGGFDYRGMSSTISHHPNFPNLPRLDTNAIGNDISGSLRTAPPFGGMGAFDMDQMFSPGSASTINPAQLHFGDALGTPISPADQFPQFPQGVPAIDDEDNFEWMRGFDAQMTFANANEHAVDEPSPPSVISTASQSGFSEIMMDGSNKTINTSGPLWSNGTIPPNVLAPAQFSMDSIGAALGGFVPTSGPLSPKSLQGANAGEAYFPQSHQNFLNEANPITPNVQTHFFNAPSNFSSESPSGCSSSINGSARHSSVTSVSTDSITEATRQALLASLSQHTGFGPRKYSQPAVSSPLSPGFGPRSQGTGSSNFPSTCDLQRFVSAYISYFHPHFPFLHIPTLSFDSAEFTTSLRATSVHGGISQMGIVGGGGCLILAMAAIGALYEFDQKASKELFESAKRLISSYLEERRRIDVSAAANGNGSHVATESSGHHTPLWLVQAMMLNIIYGHNAGDKVAADIASTHCAALVSLAKAANVPLPATDEDVNMPSQRHGSEDVDMGDSGHLNDQQQAGMLDLNAQWSAWKIKEERKRTLFALFNLSSLLVIAYNSTPAIMNSEIMLDLPCEEDLWAADTAQAWADLGGLTAHQNSISFASALSTLLTASQRSSNDSYMSSPYSQRVGSSVPLEELPQSDLKPSTFGCLVLINALHNYIWETRSRHHGRQWTTEETDSMLAHIEPALKAWQAAWAANPYRAITRPNRHGTLSADSIPLLDLAFVRLHVSMGRSKEAFFARDFEQMSEELARGHDFVQHAEYSPSMPTDQNASSNTPSNSPNANNNSTSSLTTPTPANPHIAAPPQQSGQSSKRERHLRKAAWYAADSLTMADGMGISFADLTSRELPIQSAMCTFDCAQILAEWVATVQERVGRYLGVLGQDNINFTEVPAIMLLDDEDCNLMSKIRAWLDSVEAKVIPPKAYEMADPSAPINPLNGMPSVLRGGYGSKILAVTAVMVERHPVWPVAHVMARSLEFQSRHMDQRIEASVSTPIAA